jgi:hypothetical protein
MEVRHGPGNFIFRTVVQGGMLQGLDAQVLCDVDILHMEAQMSTMLRCLWQGAAYGKTNTWVRFHSQTHTVRSVLRRNRMLFCRPFYNS